ncbi:MAG: hypothetical protein LBM02_06945 [Lachnospiraceae bacterium]|jgi:hypothetical protein|nr:hypothetical protein [Lachnospiraceae bacterium]
MKEKKTIFRLKIALGVAIAIIIYLLWIDFINPYINGEIISKGTVEVYVEGKTVNFEEYGTPEIIFHKADEHFDIDQDVEKNRIDFFFNSSDKAPYSFKISLDKIMLEEYGFKPIFFEPTIYYTPGNVDLKAKINVRINFFKKNGHQFMEVNYKNKSKIYNENITKTYSLEKPLSEKEKYELYAGL